MENLYYQLSESFKAEWPGVKNVSGFQEYDGRLFHKFLIQSSPRRELKLAQSSFGLTASCHIQGTGVFTDYTSGSFDMFPSVLIKKSDDDKFILHTINGETLETNCYDCLQLVVIYQMKRALVISDTQ